MSKVCVPSLRLQNMFSFVSFHSLLQEFDVIVSKYIFPQKWLKPLPWLPEFRHFDQTCQNLSGCNL